MLKLKPQYCLIAFLSSAFQAFGIYNVHSVSSITEGGVLGAVLLIEHWLHISPAVSGAALNAICYMLGFRTLGRSFIGYSVVAAGGFSFSYRIFEQFPPLWPGLAGYPLLAALAGALFIGIGSGVCVRIGGATCGDDALAMSLNHITRIPIQWVYMATDLGVLLLSLTYIPYQKIGWSLLTVLLSSQIIGWVQTSRKHISHA